MDIKKEKSIVILLIITVILSFTYIISFLPSFSSDKRKIVKSALINSKYLDEINKVELSENNNKLIFFKKNDLWFGYALENENVKNEQDINAVPLDKEIFASFLQKLTAVTTMYKIGDNISKSASYGLLSDNSFRLKYYYNDNDFSEIIFGDLDFSQTARYLMSGKSTTVYQINNSLENYLNVKLQFWTEPYLISRQLSNTTETSVQRIKIINEGNVKILSSSSDNYINKINSLLELRHGGSASEKSYKYIKNNIVLTPNSSLLLENGDKSSVSLEFFQLPENEIIIKCKYSNYRNDIYLKISSWTYNKYKEIML